MTIYNAQTDRLEVRVAGGGTPAWSGVYSVDGLIIKPVPTTTNVKLNHKDSASENGLIFSPNLITTQVPIVTAGDTLKFETSGLTISTGDKDAKLTTDNTYLLSDTPISAPNLVSTGLLTTGGAAVNGNLSVTGASTFTGLLTANGQIALPTPTATNHAATKTYVDGLIGTSIRTTGNHWMSGYLHILSNGPTLRVSASNSQPYIDFYSNNWAAQLGWVQCTTTSMNLYSVGDITLNSGGGQVRTVDAVYASGGLRGFVNGPCLRLIGTGHNVYTEYYGAGTNIDTPGSRYGWMGFNGSGHMQFRNEMSGGYVILHSNTGGVSFNTAGVERGRFDPSGHFLIGMSAADQYTNVGVDVAVDGEIYSIISAGRNINCNHIGAADASWNPLHPLQPPHVRCGHRLDQPERHVGGALQHDFRLSPQDDRRPDHQRSGACHASCDPGEHASTTTRSVARSMCSSPTKPKRSSLTP